MKSIKDTKSCIKMANMNICVMSLIVGFMLPRFTTKQHPFVWTCIEFKTILYFTFLTVRRKMTNVTFGIYLWQKQDFRCAVFCDVSIFQPETRKKMFSELFDFMILWFRCKIVTSVTWYNHPSNVKILSTSFDFCESVDFDSICCIMRTQYSYFLTYFHNSENTKYTYVPARITHTHNVMLNKIVMGYTLANEIASIWFRQTDYLMYTAIKWILFI